MAGSSPESALVIAQAGLWSHFFKGGRSLSNTPGVPSNGLSHHVEPYDLTHFIPEVEKSLQKLQLLRDGISIEPIIKKIADWDSPLEQRISSEIGSPVAKCSCRLFCRGVSFDTEACSVVSQLPCRRAKMCLS
jgi:hypothetical protein